MKKVFCVLLLFLFMTPFLSTCGKEPSQFTLLTYERYLEEFPSDRYMGTIKNSKDAKQKALAVWIEVYGKQVKWKWPYKVSYDLENGAWFVMGTLEFWYDFGGVPYIIFQEADGKVLAVWHDK